MDMKQAAGENLSEFDLSQIAQTVWTRRLRRKSMIDITAIAGACVLAGAFAIGAVVATVHGYATSIGSADLLLFVLFLAFAALFVWVWNCRDRYPATGLRADSNGIQVHYRTGKVSQLRWEGPGLHLKLRKEHLTPSNQLIYHASFNWAPRLIMTEAAATAVIQSARTHGLEISEVREGSRAEPSILISGAKLAGSIRP
jgi:hypothetical protein